MLHIHCSVLSGSKEGEIQAVWHSSRGGGREGKERGRGEGKGK